MLVLHVLFILFVRFEIQLGRDYFMRLVLSKSFKAKEWDNGLFLWNLSRY
jgi:hypothetical protein